MNYQEIEGDLIELALKGTFDVIAHGCNCFCTQKAGIAAVMSKTFYTDMFEMEKYIGFDKLGDIDYKTIVLGEKRAWFLDDYKNNKNEPELIVVNAYTQYRPGANLDYEALTLCLRKMNHEFKGKHIGLPLIGCGIAGGDWGLVSTIIKQELKDCNVTIVKFK